MTRLESVTGACDHSSEDTGRKERASRREEGPDPYPIPPIKVSLIESEP